MCKCTPEIRTPWCGKLGCEQPPTNQIAAPKEYGQGVMTFNRLPINQDYMAVSIAISNLLKEGWEWRGIVRENESELFIELYREWRC